ncbi:MAG: hypothetical protein QME12_06795 [Nanoarchaeota archaeon]|nr:hypothetical protein [Nanoarchaeota archaeon]
MKGLSGKEMEMVSALEFDRNYYFTRDDIRPFFKNEKLMNYYIHRLKQKGRVFRLNKNKYFLVPVRAKQGFWAEHPVVIADEIMDSKDYFIGGSFAKYYWGYIEQIPRQIDVFSTRKQGKMEIFNVTIRFRREREIGSKDYVTREMQGHRFNIATRGRTKKWVS